ncbi:MAG TPA: DinB family protein [Bryobacteraceae bacterium]|nr:DinB family protein [Bryobacteraceae bacterium]
MTSQGLASILSALEESRVEVNAAVAGLSEDDAIASADTSCWSALQCVEHVVAAEELFVGKIEQAERQESVAINPQKESELAARLVNRTTRVRAPEALRPVGRFTSIAEAVDHFNAVRAKTMKFAETRSEDLYFLSFEHRRFGVLNGVELMLLIAAHSRRHAAQIRESRGLDG